jgi:hypothetical protein
MSIKDRLIAEKYDAIKAALFDLQREHGITFDTPALTRFLDTTEAALASALAVVEVDSARREMERCTHIVEHLSERYDGNMAADIVALIRR